MAGKTPHPFLPNLSYSGVMLKAVAEWALLALLAYLTVGVMSGLIFFLWQRVGVKSSMEQLLGFKPGLWVGLGSLLWIHGLLFLDVPGTLGTVQGLNRLPIGLVLALLLLGGIWASAKGFKSRINSIWRLVGAALTILLLLHVPHDFFRRLAPRSANVSSEERRLLVIGIDGLRQDLTESAMPNWKAPGGCQPVVAVPATRLAWNMLLGEDPDSFKYHLVIPFKDEYMTPKKPGLLNAAKTNGINSIFLIDDSTTLSFLLTQTPFDEVYEPSGGWKHFFTVGAGSCWPVYSWVENYLSYIETTNPWSDDRSFFREVDRALEHHQWVSAHTCQMHAPFFLRRDEIQVLRPWRWLFHTAYSYQPYQGMEQAEQDHFHRQGGRANPINHYRIRATRILKDLDPMLKQWEVKYPKLSGVVTSDHGEEFVPVITPEGTLVSYLTGIHGFTLTPETLKVPLHPFGQTKANLNSNDIYSWLDLRDDLGRWVQGNDQLQLTRTGSVGWLISFPTVQAVHTQSKETREQGGIEGAGIKPKDYINNTYLSFSGLWFMDTPQDFRTVKDLSWAYILPDQTITLNPIGDGKYLKVSYAGYAINGNPEEISAASIESILKDYHAKKAGPWLDGK